jgi:hypothetical protein
VVMKGGGEPVRGFEGRRRRLVSSGRGRRIVRFSRISFSCPTNQVILRAATEAQTSARPTNRPTKKETECARHTKPEGVGLESPLGYKTQREARYHRPPTRQVDDLTQRLRRLTPASLFVPALHALTRMGIVRWNDQVYRRRA